MGKSIVLVAATLAILLPCPAWGQFLKAPASDKKVAVIVTAYFRYSHADNIVTRFMEGFSIVGKSYPPPCKVASLYIDQTSDIDIGRPLAKRWGVPLVKSPTEAVTLGGDKLAVDGVIIVGEHGDYPVNEKGQKLYPRRKFFEEVVKVFRSSKRSVPVFIDKHLAYNWDDAKWMYDQGKELGFPMMAGGIIPLARRIPDLQPKPGVEWQRAIAIGFGSPNYGEGYGFHTLEGLQVMMERRKGGETGVKAVQYLQGKEAWDAAKKGLWDRDLLDAALAKIPIVGKGKIEEDDADAIVYLVEYRDGTKAAAYVSPRHFQQYGFAGQIKGEKDPVACWYEFPRPQRDPFSFQVQVIAKMILTGETTYPIERPLMTTGLTHALWDSKLAGHKRIETPHLSVKYSVEQK